MIPEDEKLIRLTMALDLAESLHIILDDWRCQYSGDYDDPLRLKIESLQHSLYLSIKSFENEK